MLTASEPLSAGQLIERATAGAVALREAGVSTERVEAHIALARERLAAGDLAEATSLGEESVVLLNALREALARLTAAATADRTSGEPAPREPVQSTS